MSLPRPQNDEGLHPLPPAKRPRCSGCCDDSQMELVKEVRSMLQGQNEKIESMLQGQNEKIESMLRANQQLREKVSCLTADMSRLGGYLQQSPVPRVLSDRNFSIPLRLQFVNSCGNVMFSTHKIEADDGTPLKVAIYDNNNRIITREPFSSMRVRVVAIHGDFDNDHKGHWAEEHFHSKIVTGRPGKEHLLSGELYFRLQDGVGYLSSAKFQDNSSFVPSKRFKLGVMAADDRISERIQEGITESFAVKDVRGHATRKNPNPSPHDPVYKLSKIALNGQRHKLLEQNGINTVDKFLCFYSKNPEVLREILGKISDQDWGTIINQAHKCKPRPEICSGFIQERNVPHEHEPFSRSNGSNSLNGSCSMQPSHTLQVQIQRDVQVTNQEIFSRCNGLSCGASLENVPSQSNLQPNYANRNVVPHELDGIQVTDRQVSSLRNEILSVPSMHNNTLEGSSSQQPDGMDTDPLAFPENFMQNVFMQNVDANLMQNVDANLMQNDDFFWSLPPPENPCHTVEQNGGLSLDSEVGSISYRGPSSVRGAGSTSYWGHSSSLVRGVGSTSNANADFTGEEEISSYSRLRR